MNSHATNKEIKPSSRKAKTKWLAVVMVMVAIALTVPSLALAHNSGHHVSGSGSGAGQAWDAGHHGNGSGTTGPSDTGHHGDGTGHHSGWCGYVDADGNGLCDHCGDGGYEHVGWCGGYADADGNGVWDHCSNASARCPAYQGASGHGACNVYRLYNGYSGEHHYTLDANEYGSLGAAGWNQESICWYGCR